MDRITTSLHSQRCWDDGFTTGQIAVMDKEAGPFFPYGAAGRKAVNTERDHARYDRDYLNMALAFAGHFVTPLKPEQLRPCLVEQIPALYATSQAYWHTLHRI